VDTIRIILKYLKLLQHVSDHKGCITRELYTVPDLNYSNGSIVSVDMDVVGVMAAYLQICCHNTDYVHINGHDRIITAVLARHCIALPGD